MQEQTTDQRRRQADRFDNIALIVGAVLTLCIASWRVPSIAEPSAQPAQATPVVVAVEQGRGQ